MKKPSPSGEGAERSEADEGKLQLDSVQLKRLQKIASPSFGADAPPSPKGEGFMI